MSESDMTSNSVLLGSKADGTKSTRRSSMTSPFDTRRMLLFHTPDDFFVASRKSVRDCHRFNRGNYREFMAPHVIEQIERRQSRVPFIRDSETLSEPRGHHIDFGFHWILRRRCDRESLSANGARE